MSAVAGGALVPRPHAAVWEFDAIGTRWQVETAMPLPDAARAAVRERIDAFDREWSRFREDSLVTALARGAGEVAAPADARAMLDVYAALSAATGGAINPLVGETLARRGYDSGYGLRDRGAVPAPADWQERLGCAGGVLRLAGSGVVDVGAIGKGRLVDLVRASLRPWAPACVVDAGGDLVVSGRTLTVGLEHPFDSTRVIGMWQVTDAALCASAVNRRAWGDGLHHVLDARTGEPVRTVAATWAVAAEAMTADAVATALFFEGGPALAHGWGTQWVRMFTDGRVEWSPASTAELFS